MGSKPLLLCALQSPLSHLLLPRKKNISDKLNGKVDYGIDPKHSLKKNNDYYQHIPALLDLSTENILAPRSDPLQTNIKADEIAVWNVNSFVDIFRW